MLLEKAKKILKNCGYLLEKKSKYNFEPKIVKNISMKDGLLKAEKEHKEVLDYLQDKLSKAFLKIPELVIITIIHLLGMVVIACLKILNN